VTGSADPWPPDVELRGRVARLVPLAHAHTAGLQEAVRDGDLWRLWYTSVPAPQDMAAEIGRRLDLRAEGSMQPFAVIDQASGQPIGMTTYMNIDAAAPRVEIGSTWYRRSSQRGPINTECKLMLLTHAFETLACLAVEFRTHVFNTQSRRAIERLGARLDGILRSHTRSRDGSLRDTCVYSVIAPEWPTVRRHLEWQLERPRP
jgi:RimJ/RimL family protein N-acetyltransferase